MLLISGLYLAIRCVRRWALWSYHSIGTFKDECFLFIIGSPQCSKEIFSRGYQNAIKVSFPFWSDIEVSKYQTIAATSKGSRNGFFLAMPGVRSHTKAIKFWINKNILLSRIVSGSGFRLETFCSDIVGFFSHRVNTLLSRLFLSLV